MNLTSIYVHLEPDVDEIRYIGKADNPEQRLKEHLWQAGEGGTHQKNWLKALKARGLKPRLEVLCEVLVEEWEFWEQHYIKYFRECGFDLTNTTPGGEAGPAMPGELNPFYGRKHTERTREKMRLAKLGKPRGPFSLAHREKIAAAQRGEKGNNFGKKASKETREKLSKARQARPGSGMSGKIMSPESREKISRALKGRPGHPGLKGAASPNFGRTVSLETREKMSAARRNQKKKI